MTARSTSTHRSVLIISDDERLSGVIQAILKHCHLEFTELLLDTLQQQVEQVKKVDFNLIMIATSSLDSEPTVTTALNSLTEQIGEVPLLVISEETSLQDPDRHIFHLDFPFDIEKLLNAIEEILRQANT